MKRILLSAILLLPFLPVFAQVDEFSYNTEEYLQQLGDYMKANNNEEGRVAFEAFKTQVEAGNLTEEQLEKIIDLNNAMLKKKIRATPGFSALCSATVAFITAGRLPNQFDEWMKVSNDILKDAKTADFIKFQEFAGPFYGTNALHATPGKEWKHYSYDFTLGANDGVPFVQFSDVSIRGTTTNDKAAIYETNGIFYPLEKTFEGHGGRINWMKVLLDSMNVYATLPPSWTINLEKAEYSIDSATFFFIGYLEKPLLGTITDKIIANVTNPEEVNYPQFKSYDNSIRILDILERVDYYGAFYIKGKDIEGSGDGDLPATLKFRDDLDRVVMTARSESYLIKPTAIFSSSAAVTIHAGEDSIYHPDVNLNYQAEKRNVTLTRGKIGAAGSNYYSSYHRIDANVEQIVWGINDTSLVMKNLRGAGEKRSYFESEDLFSMEVYQAIQGVAPANPIVMIKRYCERNGVREVPANIIAKEINPSLTVDGIRSLLYDMMLQGFLFYDPETNMVTVKDKTFNYTDSYTGRKDYDIISMLSQMDGNNAELDLRKYDLYMHGIDQVYLSDSQFVLIYPTEGNVMMKKNRDMVFSGRVVGGTVDFVGKNYYFDYDTFDIKMNNVDSMILYVESTEQDAYGNVLYLPIKTSFSIIEGKLQIDRADNKSSRKDFPEYPIFTSFSTSNADYQKKETFNGVYKKDDFYFKVDPFVIEQLDKVDYSKLEFKGTMVSDGIFPDFEEGISLQADRSLGFRTTTPAAGLPMYGTKGSFKDSIFLSNEGFMGNGTIEFMASKSKSKNFYFFPDSTLGQVQDFTVTKTEGGIEFPSVVNSNVAMEWLPNDDMMHIRQGETPFNFFDGIASMKGNLKVTTKGLYGDGTMSWMEAELTSRELFFGAMDMYSDSAGLIIKSIREGVFALKMDDLNADVDFKSQHGLFRSNNDTVMTRMYYNMYKTTINEFDWDMANKFIDFKSTNQEFGTFYSMEPTQDGLNFEGTNGRLDLQTYQLKVEGIPHIGIADSWIMPDSGTVSIDADAKMRTLYNAKILGDSIMAYHTIYNATLDIWGRNSLKGTGFYKYTSPQKVEQVIPLNEITVIKKVDSLEGYADYHIKAIGYVNDSLPIELEKKVNFKGPVTLTMTDEYMRFLGYARLDIPDTTMPTAWFRIDDLINPADPQFGIDIAVTDKGDSVYAGILRSFDSTNLYMRVMGEKVYKPDPVVFAARGKGFYDEKTGVWFFGNVDKTFDPALPGSLMTYNEKSGDMEGEGPMRLGFENDIVEVRSYGKVTKKKADKKFAFTNTIAIQLPLIDDHMKNIAALLFAGNVENAPVDLYANTQLIASLNNLANAELVNKMYTSIDQLGYLAKPKELKYNLLMSNISMTWNEASKSFHSVTSTGQLIWFGEQQFNQEIKMYVEFGKKTGGEMFTIYMETPYEDFVYINCRRGQMRVYTSSDQINEQIFTADAGKRTIEYDGKRVVYQLESKPQVGKFVRKMEAFTGEGGDFEDTEEEE